MLIQSQKNVCMRPRKDGKKVIILNDDEPIDLSQSAIKVLFGRPNFERLFSDFAVLEKQKKTFYVYSTTSAPLNEAIFTAAYEVNKVSHCRFHHIYEATS